LARFFGTSDRFWLNLQAAYDLDVERDRLEREVAVYARRIELDGRRHRRAPSRQAPGTVGAASHATVSAGHGMPGRVGS
jgi:hypothetical protein